MHRNNITHAVNTGDRCLRCFKGILTESTTTYCDTGSVFECNKCKKKTYSTVTTILYPDKDSKDEVIVKRESWFDRDKREKRLVNLRKRKKR